MLVATVIGLIAVALVFDFINGFHDAANSIATVVSTRVLRPVVAVAWAAFFNFVAAAPLPFGVGVFGLGGARQGAATAGGRGVAASEQRKLGGSNVVLIVIFAALF